jgi:hypothetical protein
MTEKRLRYIGFLIGFGINLFIIWFMWHRYINKQDLLVPLTLFVSCKVWINQYLTEQKIDYLVELVENAKITRSRNS